MAKFLWYGAHNAPLVQKIFVGLLGSWIFIMGLVFMRWAFTTTTKGDALPEGIIALLLLYLGARMVRNALLRHPAQ
jgi:hypothetical protein